MFKKLARLADKLDTMGLLKEASILDKLILAGLEDFEKDIQKFRTSVIFYDNNSRIALERLLDRFNKIGEKPREKHERIRDQERFDFTNDPTKAIPVIEFDSNTNEEDLRMLLVSAKKEIKSAVEKAVEAGDWGLVNAHKYINNIEAVSDILIRRKDDPIVEVIRDFFDVVFTIAGRSSNPQDIIKVMEEQKDKEHHEELLEKSKESSSENLKQKLSKLRSGITNLYENIIADNPAHEQILITKKDNIIERLDNAINNDQWEEAKKIANEVENKWGNTKYYRELFPSLKFAGMY